MAAVSVTFDGTRVNAADANTNWGNYNASGPTPAAEAQLAYQNSLAVNKKITSTAGRQGVEYDPGAGALDMTAAAYPLAFLKGYVADFGDLSTTYGCEMVIGSGNAAYYDYNVAGSGANRAPYDAGYPAQGGYILAAINPNISAWREGTTGSPVLTAVDYFAFGAEFVVGGAKSENVAMDAIDVGRGLILTGGDGVSTDGTFIDFLTFDQDTTTNRWGVVSGVEPIVNARGLLTIGSATETDFDDSTSTVIFQDGYHGPGDVGVKVDLANASSVVNIGCTFLGVGSSTTSDTRPDFTVSGTSGAVTLGPLMTNFRNIVLTSAATVDGADLEFADMTVGGAEIKNSTLRTTSASGVAAINDAAFGTTSGIHDCTIIGNSTGHAIEITTAGTYDLTGITFDGTSFGADASNSAAIYNNSGGAVTLNIAGGGNSPTVRNGAGASTSVVLSYSLTLIVKDNSGNLLQNVEVTVVKTADDTELYHLENTPASGQAVYTYNASDAGTDVDILFMNVNYLPDVSAIKNLALPSQSQTINVTLFPDGNYSNP